MENNIIEIDVQKELISAEGRINLHIQTTIQLGELVVLFGNSGAGKTTLLRMISGLTTPDKGYIKVGQDIWFDSKSNINLTPQKRRVGFMFQDYALFPNMSVEENILFAQRERNKEKAHTLLDAFGLLEFARRKPTHLSGGQKQRVALARSIASQPNILLLDEPLSALDFAMRTALQDEISRAHQLLGATTIMVSHDLTEVFRLAHSVLKIENGIITASGTPDQLFINQQISGKVQLTGCVVKIEKQDTFYLLTVVTGMNQIIKVSAFADDVENLHEGDQVMVFSKAFNPLIMKVDSYSRLK